VKLGFVTQPWAVALPPSESVAVGTKAIAEGLADEHEPVVWSPPPPGAGAGEARLNGVEYRFVRGRGDYRALRLLERAAPLFPTRRPPFTSQLHYPSYNLQVALGLRRQRPDAIRISNFSKLVPLFRRACPPARIVLSMHCEWLNQLDRRLVNRQLRGADVIVGVSEFITERIRAAHPQHASRCVTVHNGADVEAIVPRDGGDGSGKVRLLTVGRISPEKGTHVLLEAFAKVAANRPEVELHVIGKEGLPPREMLMELDTDPHVLALTPLYRAGYLERLQSALPPQIRSRVHFHEWLRHDELAARYAAADAFVFPSIWNEPFGIPVAEAMAAGLPVVATAVGGIPEIVVDGETGILVRPGDSDSLADALDAIVSGETLRADLGRAGRRRAVERFSWSRAAEAYREIFR
jgi:glycosyltransferase involved in cell wall biosynthesis